MISLILPDGFVCQCIEVANTDALRRKGLAGRRSLIPGQGMLFVFDGPGLRSMTMAGCFVALDIIWLDENGVVEFVGCGRFTRDGGSYPGSYILELAGGQAAAHGVLPGSRIRLV